MTDKSEAGLYIHIPFCRTKCSYCDFYSVTSSGQTDDLLGAVTLEGSLRGGDFPSFSTLYIGGGTPSAVPAASIARLVDDLRGILDFIESPEFTVEVNPDDLSPSILSSYMEIGVNRLSVGAQSFDDGELHLLGRRHGAAAAFRAVEIARDSGFANIGIDLIFGFEGHTKERWRETLKKALELSPEHISCYQLTLESSEKSAGAVQGERLSVASEDLQSELFLESSRFLADNGYTHYEVSNFARGLKHRSRHNCLYWSHDPYLGLGPSAHSFRGVRRWWNDRTVGGYILELAEGRKPPGGFEELTVGQLELEKLLFGFRTSNGVDLRTLYACHGGGETVDRLVDEGLIVIDGDRAVPTREGMLVADHLPLLFSPSLFPSD